MKALKVVLALVGGIVLAFVIGTIIHATMEALRSDQTYASSVNLSISECRSTATTLGMTRGQADQQCYRRVPK